MNPSEKEKYMREMMRQAGILERHQTWTVGYDGTSLVAGQGANTSCGPTMGLIEKTKAKVYTSLPRSSQLLLLEEMRK